MTFYPHTSSFQFFEFVVFAFVIAVGWFARLARWRSKSRRRGPVLVQPNGPAAPGPFKVSGLWVRMGLVYPFRDRRYTRRVTLYAVAGRRGADGKITLELLHTVCHRLHAYRTFRVDRVITATNMQGEPIHNLSAWLLAATGVH